MQGVTGGQHRWAGCEPTLQRRLPGLAVRAAVVDLLDPGGEQAVQLGQAGDRAAGALGTVDDLDEELLAHGAEHPLDLASAGGLAGSGVHQRDAQAGAGAQQLGVDERRAVVDVDPLRDTAGGERRAQRRFQAHGVLAVPPPVAHQCPGVVVDEREQVGLAASDLGAVQGVAGPQLIARSRLEPPERRRSGAVRAGVEPEPGEVALQGPFPRCPAGMGGQHRRDVRSGPLGRLPFERGSQLEGLCRGPRLGPARVGHQRVEPAAPPGSDPAVQAGP